MTFHKRIMKSPWRVRISGVGTLQAGQRVALEASTVAIIEAEPQREVLHSVVVDVDLELVERFGVKAGGGRSIATY